MLSGQMHGRKVPCEAVRATRDACLLEVCATLDKQPGPEHNEACRVFRCLERDIP